MGCYLTNFAHLDFRVAGPESPAKYKMAANEIKTVPNVNSRVASLFAREQEFSE